MRPEHLVRAGELADELEMVQQILPTTLGSTHYKLCAYDLMLMYSYISIVILFFKFALQNYFFHNIISDDCTNQRCG